MNASELDQAIVDYLSEESGLDPDSVSVDTPLFSSGLLDSMDILKLLTFIEETTQSKIPTLEVSLETLDTVAMVREFMRTRMSDG